MDTRRSALAATLLLVLVPVLTACGTSDAASTPVGRWDGPGRAKLVVAADGTAGGNDGCNEIGARWGASDGSHGTFELSGSTDMACAGVEGWETATTWVVADGSLIIEGEDGRDLTTLTRAD